MDFVHLHLHTEYSLLDGACKIEELFQRAQQLGQKSIAITDHGAMYGVVDFFSMGKKYNIRPIIGCEVYTAPRRLTDKVASMDAENGHLVLLCKNETGYKNLIKLVSRGFTEGFYYKPRIDMDSLAEAAQGLIALSACLAGDIPRLLLSGQKDKAYELTSKFIDIFSTEDFYIELQDHMLEEQKRLNPMLLELAKEFSLKTVVTNDVHYVNQKDAKYQDVLLCIQTARIVSDQDRMRFSTDQFYLKSAEEMADMFPYALEALQNTNEVAEKCQFEFDFSQTYLPKFNLSPEQNDSFSFLKNLCLEGMNLRYDDNQQSEHSVLSRLDYELSVIQSMGYVDYFLIVWDFVDYAKRNGIIVGPGRGSAAGSIVAYCLGITQVDPLRHELYFERFLNPDRVSMPDIDIDFCYVNRQKVIDYVISKYGADHVSQIITFGTMAAKAAVRDSGRAMGMSYQEVDRIAKMIPTELNITLNRAIETSQELQLLYRDDMSVKELLDTAMALEGLPRHASTHAAGVVISAQPLEQVVPLQKNDDVVTTQFPMGTIERLGLLKMDFLGLRTLTVIQDTLDMIGNLELSQIPLDDSDTFEMIKNGDTDGVFQLESGGMTQFMKELAPTCLEDIIAGIALYRPGPMEKIPEYIRNKLNPQNIEYKTPLLEPILSVTYGVIVYQEQVMQIFRALAGYSLAQADEIRRAMSKKKLDVMEKARTVFIHGSKQIKGCIQNGIDEKTANSIFNDMSDFAKYAFNKSHATAYAYLAYHTAYLKCKYKHFYMAALMTGVLDNQDKVARYISDCKKRGINILPPCINKSQRHFTVDNGDIRFGLLAIKNVGQSIIVQIIDDRNENGEFSDFNDFCKRHKSINKRAMEALVRSGAFDCFNVYRKKLIMVYERLLQDLHKEVKDNLDGQFSLFDHADTERQIPAKIDYPDVAEFSSKELLAMEKEFVGAYVSGHPLDEYKEILQVSTNCDIGIIKRKHEQNQLRDGQVVTIGGIITSRKNIITKTQNAQMAFINVMDYYGTIEVVIFSKILEKFGGLINIDNAVIIKGKISVKEDEEPKLLANNVEPCQAVTPIVIKIDSGREYLFDQLRPIVLGNRGTCPLFVDYNGQKIASIYKVDEGIRTVPIVAAIQSS